MTRINVVPVQELTGKHLVAEYRELPRVFALASKAVNWQSRQPKAYTMGTGHVLFFYDKLSFLADRQEQIVKEMLHRGYKPTFTACLVQQWRESTHACMWQGYVVTEDALSINRERITKRLAGE